jgi:AP2 domain/HNH endonuclease
MKPKTDIPLAYLRACFVIDTTVGSGLRWRYRADMSPQWNSRCAGKEAGTPTAQGYWCVSLTLHGRQHRLRAHRIIFALTHGHWPPHELDHKNGVEAGNGIDNLRAATPSQNQHNRKINRNNTSGYSGVCWDKRRGKWEAKIKIGGRQFRLGYFDTQEEAYAAYLAAKALVHPFAPIPRGTTMNILPRSRFWAAQRVLKAARKHRDTTLEAAAWEAFEPLL